jgi:hypothetical protein
MKVESSEVFFFVARSLAYIDAALWRLDDCHINRTGNTTLRYSAQDWSTRRFALGFNDEQREDGAETPVVIAGKMEMRDTALSAG